MTIKKRVTRKSAAKAAPKRKAAAKRKAPAKKKVVKAAAKRRPAAKKKAAAKKKPAAKKAAKKRPAKKKAAPKKKTARKPNAAFMKPMQPDMALGAVVGAKPIPRTEITKKLWEYIKKNNLQNPANRREIMADSKLQPLFDGKKKVNMFEMTKLVSKHMK